MQRFGRTQRHIIVTGKQGAERHAFGNQLLAQLIPPRHARIAVFNPTLVQTNTVLFQRLAVAHQPRFPGGGVDWDGDTGDLPVALIDQVIHGLKRGILLFEEDAAIRCLAHFTVNDHQRRLHGIHQLDDRFFAHIARVKHDGITLAIGQHLHRLFFLFRRVVAIGDDQLFPVGFGLP